MFFSNLERVAFMAYVLTVFGGSYLAVSTVRGVWEEGRKLEMLAALRENEMNHKVLDFDAIEPAAGK